MIGKHDIGCINGSPKCLCNYCANDQNTCCFDHFGWTHSECDKGVRACADFKQCDLSKQEDTDEG